jgi:hypothetical protein
VCDHPDGGTIELLNGAVFDERGDEGLTAAPMTRR